MEKLDFNENQSVFRVGESSDKMFLLVKGKVGIFLPKNETKDADFFVEENDWQTALAVESKFPRRSFPSVCMQQRGPYAEEKRNKLAGNQSETKFP